MRLQNCDAVEEFCANFLNLTGFGNQWGRGGRETESHCDPLPVTRSPISLPFFPPPLPPNSSQPPPLIILLPSSGFRFLKKGSETWVLVSRIKMHQSQPFSGVDFYGRGAVVLSRLTPFLSGFLLSILTSHYSGETLSALCNTLHFNMQSLIY